MKTRKYHLRALLAVVTGLAPASMPFDELQGIHEFLSEDFTGRGNSKLLVQYPWLADCEKDLTIEELAILKLGQDRPKINEILESWISSQVSEHGEYFDVNV